MTWYEQPGLAVHVQQVITPPTTVNVTCDR